MLRERRQLLPQCTLQLVGCLAELESLIVIAVTWSTTDLGSASKGANKRLVGTGREQDLAPNIGIGSLALAAAAINRTARALKDEATPVRNQEGLPHVLKKRTCVNGESSLKPEERTHESNIPLFQQCKAQAVALPRCPFGGTKC